MGHRQPARRRVLRTTWEVAMALARAVMFDGVSKDRMDAMSSEMQGQDPPERLNAKELVGLHAPEGEPALVGLFLENEDGYRQGEESPKNLGPGDNPGSRSSVTRYDVAFRDSM